MPSVFKQTRVDQEVWFEHLSPVLQRVRGSDRIPETEIKTDWVNL